MFNSDANRNRRICQPSKWNECASARTLHIEKFFSVLVGMQNASAAVRSPALVRTRSPAAARVDAHRPRRKPWQWVSAVACCFAHLNVYLIIGGIGGAPRLLLQRRAIARETSEPNGRRDAIEAMNTQKHVRAQTNLLLCVLFAVRCWESRVGVPGARFKSCNFISSYPRADRMRPSIESRTCFSLFVLFLAFLCGDLESRSSPRWMRTGRE